MLPEYRKKRLSFACLFNCRNNKASFPAPPSPSTEHGFWRAPSHFRLNPSTPLRAAAAFPPTPPPQRSSSAKAHRGCWRRETDRPPQHSAALRGAARTYLPRTASPTAQPAGPQHHSSGGKRNLRPPLQGGDGQRSAFLAGPLVFPPGPQWRSTGRKRRAGRARRRLHGDDGAAEEAAGSVSSGPGRPPAPGRGSGRSGKVVRSPLRLRTRVSTSPPSWRVGPSGAALPSPSRPLGPQGQRFAEVPRSPRPALRASRPFPPLRPASSARAVPKGRAAAGQGKEWSSKHRRVFPWI